MPTRAEQCRIRRWQRTDGAIHGDAFAFPTEQLRH